MCPYIMILGRQISMYAVCALIGGIFMVLLSVLLAKKRGKNNTEDVFYMLLFAGIDCLIGAKLLYIIVDIRPSMFVGLPFDEQLHFWYAVLTQGGFVFYGGLAGAFFGALLYTKRYKLPTLELIEAAVPGVPLFHGFGRIGCFMAGCCYGKLYKGALAVTFEHSYGAPNGVSLFPVQLLEAVCNFILCGVLSYLYARRVRKGIVSGAYLISYAVIRFVTEYFRGDDARGRLLCFSVSQWISIAAFGAGIAVIVLCGKKAKKSTDI